MTDSQVPTTEARRPRWALWNFDTAEWDEVPPANAPGEWNGGHNYGEARATLREAIEAIEPIGLPDAQLIQRDAVLALFEGVPASPLEAQLATVVESLQTLIGRHVFTHTPASCDRCAALAVLSDLPATSEQYAARLRAKERERLRNGLTYLWENGEEVGWRGPFCVRHHAPAMECDCEGEDLEYEPDHPPSSTRYCGFQWLLRDAVLALLSEVPDHD